MSFLIKSKFVLEKKSNVSKFHPKCTICKDMIRDIKNKIENSPAEVRFGTIGFQNEQL